MRFAVSAVVALSGLLLLGLAFYGEPAVYLRQAREQWDALMDRPTGDHIAEPDPQAEQAAQLRQEVARLRQALAAREQIAEPSPTAQEAPPAAAAPVPPQPPEPAQPPAPRHPPAAEAGPASPPVVVTLPAPAVPPSPPPAAAPAIPTLAIPDQPKPSPHAVEVPERHVAAAEPLKLPAPAKPIAAPRQVPAPQPLPQPSPRQEADDTQSVLARLRQGTAPPDPQLEAPLSAPSPAPSPALPRLLAARAALARGTIEGARRLLQEAQLQLVFRPMTPDGDPVPAAARGAANVAHALDALSGNDIPLAQRYVAVALDDLSGKQTNPPIQQSSRIGSGYAPAYPPR